MSQDGARTCTSLLRCKEDWPVLKSSLQSPALQFSLKLHGKKSLLVQRNESAEFQ